MRSTSYQWWFVGSMALGLVSGCQEVALPTGLDDSGPGPEAVIAQAEADAAVAAEAEAYAQRVAAMEQQQPPQPVGPPQEILWRDMGGASSTVGEVAPSEPMAESGQRPTADEAGVPVEAVDDTKTQAVTTAAAQDGAGVQLVSTNGGDVSSGHAAGGMTAAPTQAQAYRQLLEAVRHGDDSNLAKAVAAATLATVGPHNELDWSMLSSLSPTDKKRVESYHRAVSALRTQLLSGDGEIDREAIAGQLEEMYGHQPVAIRTIELCEKVMGYGVYDAFPGHTFVAGREQKLIVYVELDHFLPVKSETGNGYEVRLRQELELYESNGFEVWSHEPVKITDVSHNKRRDFFVVQLVTLPAQLRMGQYHLKVRVYDENAGTRDEATLVIRLVADDTLVKQSGR